MSKRNPLHLIEAMQQYQLNKPPLKRAVVDRLIRQGYLKKAFGTEDGKRVPFYYLTYRGNVNKSKTVLPGWEDWQDEVEYKEMDLSEQSDSLYGNF